MQYFFLLNVLRLGCFISMAKVSGTFLFSKVLKFLEVLKDYGKNLQRCANRDEIFKSALCIKGENCSTAVCILLKKQTKKTYCMLHIVSLGLRTLCATAV